MADLDHIDLHRLIEERSRSMGGYKAFADHVGISKGYLSDVLSRRREPGRKLLKELGLVRVVRFAKARTDSRTTTTPNVQEMAHA